jgi:hypothetical protein
MLTDPPVSTRARASGSIDEGTPVKPWRRSSAGRSGDPVCAHAACGEEVLGVTDDVMVPASHTGAADPASQRIE